MKKRYLEAGKIVNTHGVTGEVKVQSWCDSPEVLAGFDTLYDAEKKLFRVQKAYVHKGCVIMRLEGVNTCEAAEALRGTVLYLDREDVDRRIWFLCRICWDCRCMTAGWRRISVR